MTDLSPEKYRHDLEIVRATAEQLIKDFQLFGFEIRFSGDPFTAYDELRAQLVPVIDRLQREDPLLFQSLLYRIDLDERLFKKKLSSSDDHLDHFADLILQREFKKVLTRKFFSDRESK